MTSKAFDRSHNAAIKCIFRNIFVGVLGTMIQKMYDGMYGRVLMSKSILMFIKYILGIHICYDFIVHNILK